MPKKQKRSLSSGAGPSTAFVSSPTQSTPRASYVQEFAPDYGHVTRDLKQIGVLVGIFVAALFVLSFFLR